MSDGALEEATSRLLEIERDLRRIWRERLPEIGGDRTDDIVVAHRSVHTAVEALRRADGVSGRRIGR